MTKPVIETVWRNGGRWYQHPLADEEPPRDRVLPWSPLVAGVTTVLNSKNKPALVGWAAKMAAEFAVDNVEVWTQLPSRVAKVELIKGASKRSSGEAADLGTAAHGIAEQIGAYKFLGGPKPMIPAHLVDFAKTYLRFLTECKAKPVYLEQTVWNHTLGYAGTFDGIYTLGDEPELVCVDTKTGKSGIYPETALQQVAYINGEVIVNPEGTETEMPPVTKAYALWLRPNGYALHPLRVGPEEFEVFKALLTVAKWEGDIGAAAVKKPINPVPLRK